MSVLLDLPQVWTIEDLQQLPDDDLHRYEIVDGALVMSPPPELRHQYGAALLHEVLAPQLPAPYMCAENVGIALAGSYRVPDLTVVDRRRLATRGLYAPPAEVLLAVEIVSASSQTTDRITKPAQYAAAGILAYWRIETEPEVSLTAYALPAGATSYVELGTWHPGEVAEIAEPFPVRIAIDDLVPRP